MAVDRLPVVGDRSRIFPDQIGLDLLHGLGARSRAAFRERLAQAGDAGVSMHFHKEPARFDKKRLEFRDLDLVLR